MKKILVGVLAAIIGLMSLNAQSKNDKYKNPSLPIGESVDDLRSKMALQEKVAQMRIFHANKGIEFSDKNKLILPDNVKSRLEFTGIAMEKILEEGDYTVMVGTSSQDYETETFRLGQ